MPTTRRWSRTAQGPVMKVEAPAHRPEVLARLAHDATPAPVRRATPKSTRWFGAGVCLLIVVLVVLAASGSLL